MSRPGDTILALFRGRMTANGHFQAVQAMGTGFMVAPGVLVTCWHCVHTADDEPYVAVCITGDRPRQYLLRDVEQDPAGCDLATARLDYDAAPFLRVSDFELEMDSEVASYGYPLTQPVSYEPGFLQFEMHPRLLRGYVARAFTRHDDTFGLVLSYELDMLAPTGLSGSPLFWRAPVGILHSVVGVVYGVNETYSIAEEASIDTSTGEARPEVRRMVSFALAHTMLMLGRVAGRATNGKPLRDYLDERSLLEPPPE